MLALLNQIRQANGMGPLSPDARVTAAAQAHSADMAARNTMSHTGANGSNAGGRLSAAGVAWRTYGEVVAAGQTSAQAAVNGWMNSPPHRQVILHPGLTHAGVGYAVSAAGRTYWTVDFAAR